MVLENWLVWEKHLHIGYSEMFCVCVEEEEFFLSPCSGIDIRILINS